MKYNLIFENIPEVIPNTDMKEDTQQILKDFLQSELEIENVQFHNVLSIIKLYFIDRVC
jgi:hypothetical protein